MSSVDLVVSIGTVAVSAIGASITSRGSVLRGRREAAMQRAADEVLAVLSRLHSVVDISRYEPPQAAQVAALMREWESAARRNEWKLPRVCLHLRQSVREAACTYLGAPAAVGIDPRGASEPLSPFEYHWWDVALTYIEYVMRELQDLDGLCRRRARMTPFNEWRREEDASWRWAG
ncbi:MAG TPA: hypothetical protein VG650_04065 [Mycobacteriales bacterium]|nr:hypothetical protein [Mycobacteriales bacterium]